jgi:hypothetical protein
VVNPGDPYRTDLLMGESPETNQSEAGSPKGVIGPRGVASAYEKGKARGILWGGMDDLCLMRSPGQPGSRFPRAV